MKEERERFGKLVMLAIAAALVASVGMIAYAADRIKQVTDANEHRSVNPSSKDIVWDNELGNRSGGGGSYRDVVNNIECILADDFLFDAEQQGVFGSAVSKEPEIGRRFSRSNNLRRVSVAKGHQVEAYAFLVYWSTFCLKNLDQPRNLSL